MVLRVKVSDKGSHQASLADAGRQSKSQGHKVTLKIGADRIHSVDSTQCRFQIHTFAELYGVGDPSSRIFNDCVCGLRRDMTPLI